MRLVFGNSNRRRRPENPRMSAHSVRPVCVIEILRTRPIRFVAAALSHVQHGQPVRTHHRKSIHHRTESQRRCPEFGRIGCENGDQVQQLFGRCVGDVVVCGMFGVYLRQLCAGPSTVENHQRSHDQNERGGGGGQSIGGRHREVLNVSDASTGEEIS